MTLACHVACNARSSFYQPSVFYIFFYLLLFLVSFIITFHQFWYLEALSKRDSIAIEHPIPRFGVCAFSCFCDSRGIHALLHWAKRRGTSQANFTTSLKVRQGRGENAQMTALCVTVARDTLLLSASPLFFALLHGSKIVLARVRHDKLPQALWASCDPSLSKSTARSLVLC